MTVAIGMYGIGGVFVCADSHVVSTDGIVTYGCKIKGIESKNVSFVIADAGDDANAADMLADEILDALRRTRGHLGSVVKKTMKAWHAGYVHNKPPSTQFILALCTGPESRGICFCEPPNTVVRKSLDECAVIGVGAQILDSLVPEVMRGPLLLREALIRAAYLMYRAKKEHVFLKGSDTHALVIAENTRKICQMTVEEMQSAEALGPDVDSMLRYCYLGLLGTPHNMGQKEFLKGFNKTYLQTRKKIDAISFPTLDAG